MACATNTVQAFPHERKAANHKHKHLAPRLKLAANNSISIINRPV